MKRPVYKFGWNCRADSFALLFPTDITFNSRTVIISKSVVIQYFKFICILYPAHIKIFSTFDNTKIDYSRLLCLANNREDSSEK